MSQSSRLRPGPSRPAPGAGKSGDMGHTKSWTTTKDYYGLISEYGRDGE